MKYKFIFWFNSNNGNGSQKAHEIFYQMYSFILLFIVLVTAVMHFEIFSISSQIGNKLKEILKKDEIIVNEFFNEKLIMKDFQPLTNLYILSKILVVAILANMYTWKAQNPGFIGMLEFTIIAVAILGTLIVSYPRYHIQYWIFRIWEKNNEGKYPDIRGPLAKGIVSIMDIIILGSVMINLIYYVIKRLMTLK